MRRNYWRQLLVGLLRSNRAPTVLASAILILVVASVLLITDMAQTNLVPRIGAQPSDPTATATSTATPGATATVTATATLGPTPTVTATATVGPTPTVTATATATATATVTATATATATVTPTVTATATVTPTPAGKATPTATVLTVQGQDVAGSSSGKQPPNQNFNPSQPQQPGQQGQGSQAGSSAHHATPANRTPSNFAFSFWLSISLGLVIFALLLCGFVLYYRSRRAARG